MTKDDDPTSDEALVRATLAGNEEAERKLCARIAGYVRRRLQVMVARGCRGLDPAALQEDALQEFWVRLFQEDARLLREWSPEKGPLRPWVVTIASNATLNVLAKQRRRTDREDLEEDMEPIPTTQPSQEARISARHLVARVLAALSPREQEMVMAYFAEGWTAKEVAHRFETTEHAVHVWASRVRKRLRPPEDPS